MATPPDPSSRLDAARSALDGGDPASLLGGWRFATRADAVAVVVDGLRRAPPTVGPALLARCARTPGPGEVDLAAHQERYKGVALEPALATAEERVAWGLAELSFYGDLVEHRERGAWGREAWRDDPKADAATAELWLALLRGHGAWAARDGWEKRFLKAATSSFRQVLASRSIPRDAQHQALEELREGFWYQLLGVGEGMAGWRSVAARVLETAPPTPLERLAGLCTDREWTRATACVAGRGYWPDTLQRLMPDLPGAAGRSLALASRLSPADVEATVDFHVALRLLESWRRGGRACLPTRSWGVVTQNVGRSRARLRSLVAERDAGELIAAVCGLGSLRARTDAAVRRWAWAWAWKAMAGGLQVDFTAAVEAACTVPEEGPPPLGPEQQATARSWVLLVLFKGRLEHLERWTRTGGTGDRDGTWARLLQDAQEAGLADPDAGGRAATYHALRAWLGGALDDELEACRELVEAVGQLPPGRDLRTRFEALVQPAWEGQVPFPKSGFPTFCRQAADAAALLAGRSDA